MITGEFFLLGLLSPMLASLLCFILILLVAVTVASTRNVADPDHKRLTATYLCAVLFVSLFAGLFAASHAVGSLLAMAGSDDVEVEYQLSPSFDDEGDPDFDEQFFDHGPEADEDKIGEAVTSLVFALVAGAVVLYHRGKLIELQVEEGFADSPAAPVFLTYLYVSLFVAMVALVVGATQALDGFAHVIAPGSLSSRESDLVREEGARRLFTGAFLGVAALAVVVLHQRERARLDAPPEAEPAEPPDQGTPDYPIA